LLKVNQDSTQIQKNIFLEDGRKMMCQYINEYRRNTRYTRFKTNTSQYDDDA
jgi:hypothetical protein